MTEEALSSFYESMPPLRSQGWQDMLREFFVNFYTLLAADPLKCDLIVRRIGGQDGGEMRTWARAEELLAALTDAGFPPSLAQHAFFTLSIYTQGFLLVERTGRVATAMSVPSADIPGNPPEDFEFGVSNIIAGLRLMLPQGQERTDAA